MALTQAEIDKIQSLQEERNQYQKARSETNSRLSRIEDILDNIGEYWNANVTPVYEVNSNPRLKREHILVVAEGNYGSPDSGFGEQVRNSLDEVWDDYVSETNYGSLGEAPHNIWVTGIYDQIGNNNRRNACLRVVNGLRDWIIENEGTIPLGSLPGLNI